MKEYYEESLHMIRCLSIKLTKKQYRKLAKRFKLLSPESMEYISQKSFSRIITDNIE